MFDSIAQSILRWSEDKFIFDKFVVELVAEETHLNVCDSDSAKFSPSVYVKKI